MGSFDFSRLPRYWAEDMGKFLFSSFACPCGFVDGFFLFVPVHSGRSDMTDGLRGLIGALRGGHSNWHSFDRA